MSINEYAYVKQTDDLSKNPLEDQRKWSNVARGELLFFIASHTYSCVVNVGDKRNYFAGEVSSLLPRHHSLDVISRVHGNRYSIIFMLKTHIAPLLTTKEGNPPILGSTTKCSG